MRPYGAVGYLLRKWTRRFYGTRLTLGSVDSKLKEHGLSGRARLNLVKQGATVKMGCMSVDLSSQPFYSHGCGRPSLPGGEPLFTRRL